MKWKLTHSTRMNLKPRRVDVFGKPHAEIVDDLSDPTPVYISGDRSDEFYDSLEMDEADLVIVREQDALPEAAEEFLEGHYELCSYLDTGQEVYVSRNAPTDFPGMKPQEVETLAEDSVEALANEYLEGDSQ